jgi:hypothetical protein
MPDQFWSLTWGEFWRMYKGYMKRLDFENRRMWVHTAEQMSLLYNLNRTNKMPLTTPDDFLPKQYLKDRPESLPKTSPEAMRKRIEDSKRFDGKGVKKTVYGAGK